jgi:hypothetical protein
LTKEEALTHASRTLGASALVIVFTLTMAAVPGSASERPARSDTKGPGLLVSAQAQVQRMASSAKAVKFASAQEGTAGYDDPGSFLRSKRGVALLVLAGAGIGYMWYSKVHDRIHSERRAESND